MENLSNTLKVELKRHNRKHLQKISKKLKLPTNCKKEHLINLIVARKTGMEEQVQQIQEKIKAEKGALTYPKNARKSRLFSPPICTTPKKIHQNMRQKPDKRSLLKYNPRTQLLQRLNNDEKNTLKLNTSRNMVINKGSILKIPGVTLRKCVHDRPTTEILLNGTNLKVVLNKNPPISRIEENEISKTNLQGFVGVRKPDGTITTLNAIIQNRNQIQDTQENNIVTTDSSSVDENILDSSFSETDINNLCQEISTEEIVNEEQTLPVISDVFSKFQYNMDLTQALYAPLGDENGNSIICPPVSNSTLTHYYNLPAILLPFPVKTTNVTTTYSTSPVMTSRIQAPVVVTYTYPIPNLPENFETDESTYSTPECTSDMDISEGNLPDYFETDESTYSATPDTSDFDYSEDFNSAMGCSLELGANVTIPEMVEDAIHIISNDEDYMKGSGLETKVTCMFCDWAGPALIIEFHIHETHPNEIHKQDKSECNIIYTLSEIVHESVWHSKVIEYNSVLYVLSAKYEDPDDFKVTLSSMSGSFEYTTGSITVYNKITGEPYSWSGEIKPVPVGLPHENNLSCLKLNLSKLDLLPNSANLRITNRGLVTDSPTKVVVGQNLNDIQIILFIKLFNSS